MIVVATGPRSSGTTLLYRVLETAGLATGPRSVHPIHLPVYPPEGIELAAELPRALYAVSVRTWLPTVRSMVGRGFHPTEAEASAELNDAHAALERLGVAVGDRARVLPYEGLLENPAYWLATLDGWLRRHGYDGRPPTLPEEVRDENAKWLAPTPQPLDAGRPGR